MPVNDHAVDRNLLSRPNAHCLVQPYLLDGNVDLLAVAHHARGLWLQADQPLDGLGGLAARALLERLAEIDQRDDHRRRFEIGVPREAWNDVREERDRRRVQPGRTGAEGDQRIHVGVIGAQRLPCADEEMPA